MVKSYALKQFSNKKGVIYKLCRKRRYLHRYQTGSDPGRIREIAGCKVFPVTFM